MNKIELVKHVTKNLDNLGVTFAHTRIREIERAGIVKGMHEGEEETFFENDTLIAEWILGQYLGILKTRQFYAMDALINYSYTWMEDKS